MERKNEAKKTIWQMVKFAIVGVLNTLVDFAVFQALNLLLGWVYVAQVIGYSCGIINSYLWNSNWTFREQRTRSVGRPSQAQRRQDISNESTSSCASRVSISKTTSLRRRTSTSSTGSTYPRRASSSA